MEHGKLIGERLEYAPVVQHILLIATFAFDAGKRLRTVSFLCLLEEKSREDYGQPASFFCFVLKHIMLGSVESIHSFSA